MPDDFVRQVEGAAMHLMGVNERGCTLLIGRSAQSSQTLDWNILFASS
jgi:hypothetical protein